MSTRRPAHQPTRGTAAPRGFVSPWEHGSRLYRTLVLTGSALFLVGIVLAVVGGTSGRLAVLSLIHISEPTRPLYISYAVFCLKKKKK